MICHGPAKPLEAFTSISQETGGFQDIPDREQEVGIFGDIQECCFVPVIEEGLSGTFIATSQQRLYSTARSAWMRHGR